MNSSRSTRSSNSKSKASTTSPSLIPASKLIGSCGIFNTETLVAEILSGKVKIKDKGIADAPYDQRTRILQKDLPLKVVESQILRKVAIAEFQKHKKETQKKPNPKRKRVVKVYRKKAKLRERRNSVKKEALSEEQIETAMMKLDDKMDKLEIATKVLQRKIPSEQNKARIRRVKKLEKRNIRMANVIMRILCTKLPKGKGTERADVKQYEALVQRTRHQRKH